MSILLLSTVVGFYFYLRPIWIANIEKVEQLTEKFKNSSAIYFAKYTGMNVENASKLRMEFIDNDVDFYISKNTLTKIAAENAGVKFPKIVTPSEYASESYMVRFSSPKSISEPVVKL